jgi:hypothetical protein
MEIIHVVGEGDVWYVWIIIIFNIIYLFTIWDFGWQKGEELNLQRPPLYLRYLCNRSYSIHVVIVKMTSPVVYAALASPVDRTRVFVLFFILISLISFLHPPRAARRRRESCHPRKATEPRRRVVRAILVRFYSLLMPHAMHRDRTYTDSYTRTNCTGARSLYCIFIIRILRVYRLIRIDV